MKNVIFLFSFVALWACSATSGDKPDYFGFEKGEKLAELTNKKIKEVSGIAASLANPGHLWLHNDSGHDAEVFLVDETLSIKLTCRLKGIDNRDWEDIDAGPGPDSTKTYVYVGEIGDNLGRYNYKMIYRFEEPDLAEGKTEVVITDFDTIIVQLPDERKDTETLMIDPHTKDLYLISKREHPVTVYKIKNEAEPDTIVAERVGTIDLTYIVGGGFSHDGREVIIKNIDNVYYWQLKPNEKFEDVIDKRPHILPYKKEAQGEAIGFSHDDGGYYTISELKKKEKSFLRFYRRKVE